MNNALNKIVATLVPAHARMDFLVDLFGARQMIVGENLVYTWMGKLCTAYNGFWEFHRLSNGGMYMAPSTSAWPLIECRGNHFRGYMSPDAAGIVATLFALCELAAQGGGDRASDAFHALREFAVAHAEAKFILAAID